MADTAGISFNPTDAVSGGGLIDDTEAVLVSLRSCLFDYAGKIPAPIVALHATWQYLVEGVPQLAHEYYSAGDTKNLAPSADGRQLIPVGTQGGLNDSCNAFKLMVSLINGGFPKPIGRDLAVFDGSRCYVKRIPQPKVGTGGKDSKPLLVQKYLGEGVVQPVPQQGAVQAQAPAGLGQALTPAATVAQVAVAQAQGAAQAVMAQAPAAGSPLHEKAVGVMLNLLAGKGGSVPKAAIAASAFGMLANDPDRNALVMLMFTDSFLGGPGVPWKFDGTTASL